MSDGKGPDMLKVLVAHDGSECSEKALRDLRKAGMPETAEAVVLTVADTWINQSPASCDYAMNPQVAVFPGAEYNTMKSSLNDAEATSRQAAEKLKIYFPDWEVRSESIADVPVSGIINKIEAWRPDLVVMGSHGRSAAGRFFFGSVSRNVISHVHCNVRISRGRDDGERKIAPLRLVVAYDGSQESETAFEAALCRNWPKGTTIRLITVMDMRVSLAFFRPTGPIRYWMRNEDKNSQDWVERMLSDQKRRIQEKGLLAFTEVLKGDAKRTLLKAAEEWGADTIFVGSRGLTGSRRIIAGSVSTALATHAHCSVEVVHRLWDAGVCCEEMQEQHRECMSRN